MLSLLSRPVHSLDVPEVKKFEARFRYSFFVSNESNDEVGNVPSDELESINDGDVTDVDSLLLNVPRSVELRWSSVTLSEEFNSAGAKMDSNPTRDLISSNRASIISEDQFSSDSFISVNFHDAELSDRIFSFISGSIQQLGIHEERSNTKAFKDLSGRLNDFNIDPEFVSDYYGTFFGHDGDSYYTQRINADLENALSSIESDKIKLENSIKAKLKDVNLNVQINSKVVHDLINNAVLDPTLSQASDFKSLHESSKTLQDSAKRLNALPYDDEYKTIVPVIMTQVQNSTHVRTLIDAQVVGYMIDKWLVVDGNIVEREPIIIDNPSVVRTFDLRIKYGATYRYQVRAIILFTLPAIDVDTNQQSMVKFLASSKPTQPVYVECKETKAPPPPNDPEFRWNYTIDRLNVSWTMPVNSQRDIKKFQVFSRDSLDQPFTLRKVLDFDDSEIKARTTEIIQDSMIQVAESPVTSWIDETFVKTGRRVYAIVSIDAHGMSSGYSSQFEITFDQFSNSIVKKHVSHSGAPKQYPNLYIGTEAFVDVARTSGLPNMDVYFNPECYSLIDSRGNKVPVVNTTQLGGSYRFEITNLDNNGTTVVRINIDDRQT